MWIEAEDKCMYSKQRTLTWAHNEVAKVTVELVTFGRASPDFIFGNGPLAEMPKVRLTRPWTLHDMKFR
jgi:hypothetical protein